MRSILVVLLTLVAVPWALWSVTLSGFTVFAYLGTGPDAWNAHLSYALSAVGLIPFIGGLIASFMADTVHGWGFFHAAFNFLGYIPLLAFVGYLGGER